MRVDFNILWVEDQPQNVKAQTERIALSIRKEGFRLQVRYPHTVEEAKTYLASDVYGDHIDLILMDYDLGTAPMGDDGLAEVRNVFRYKDIVFYSARADDVLAMVAAKRIQGVFCSTREDLPVVVYGVFEALVKQVLDIDHSRGIIMGAASDIDSAVNDCLMAACDEGGKLHADALRIIAARIVEIRKRFETEAAAVESTTETARLLELHNIYTSVDRLNLLRRFLTPGGKYATQCTSMKEYATKTIPKRNILAHVRVQRDGFARKLVDKDGNELTCEEVRALRLSLLEHIETLESLAASLRTARTA